MNRVLGKFLLKKLLQSDCKVRPAQAGRLFKPRKRIGHVTRDGVTRSRGGSQVLRSASYSQLPCVRFSVRSCSFDPASTPTSRMTGLTRKPSSLVRASFLALFAVCQLALTCACTPAVIWCPHESSDDAVYRTAPSSPLQKLTSEEFEKSLSQLNVTEPAIVADELCVEDLRNSKVSLSLSRLLLTIYLRLYKRDTYQSLRKEYGKR